MCSRLGRCRRSPAADGARASAAAADVRARPGSSAGGRAATSVVARRAPRRSPRRPGSRSAPARRRRPRRAAPRRSSSPGRPANDSAARSGVASAMPCWTTHQLPSGVNRKHVVVELIAVLDGGVVDLGRRAGSPAPAPPDPARDARRRARSLRASCARRHPCRRRRTKPKSCLEAAHRLLDRAAGRGRDAARVPVEAEHAAERLEPERIRQPRQHLARAVVGDHMAEDLAREPDHAPEQPGRRPTAVQRQIRKPDPTFAQPRPSMLARPAPDGVGSTCVSHAGPRTDQTKSAMRGVRLGRR